MPNAKVLESKKAIVDALADKLQGATSAVFVDYKGITVAQDTELRRKFREAGVEYTVVKNTLTRFAANKAGYNQFDELLNGTTSMACTTGDPIAPARIVCEFAKKNKNVVKLKGGFVEGSVMSVEQLQGFGELPSKDALVWHSFWIRSVPRKKAPLQKPQQNNFNFNFILGGYYNV